MHTFHEIQQALEKLDADGREALAVWLQDVTETRCRSGRVAEPYTAYGSCITEPDHLTLERYLELEERSPIRHEYINGTAYAMASPSIAHNLVSQAVFGALVEHLKGGPCRAYIANLQLRARLEDNDVIYYPDVMVACEPGTGGLRYVPNPKLVVEVLSPATRHIDRREKAMNYRRIDSVEEYVLAAQDEYRVSLFRRAEQWIPQRLSGSDAVAELRSVGLALPLRCMYEGVLDG